MVIDGLLGLMMQCDRYSRRDLEDVIVLARPRTGAGFKARRNAALCLAATGTLDGPDSRLGATRQEALAALYEHLIPRDVRYIAWIAAVYDATAPHPPAATYLLGEQAATTP
jgi:hypothetical protein